MARVIEWFMQLPKAYAQNRTHFQSKSFTKYNAASWVRTIMTTIHTRLGSGFIKDFISGYFAVKKTNKIRNREKYMVLQL